MMDFQQRQDIHRLQEQLRIANERIAELEGMLADERSKPVQVETVLKHAPPIVEIRRVEVPVVEYRKCPKQQALIRELQAKIGGR